MHRLAALLAFAATLGTASAGDFYRAIRENDLALLGELSKDKAAANAPDGHRVTPLIYAALYGSPEAVRLLVRAGADYDAASDIGLTPLIGAACNPEKVKELLAAGANVNAATKSGRTALIVAAACPGTHDVLPLLLAKGADVKAVDQSGRSALHVAAAQSGAGNSELLIAKGAPVDAKDHSGLTPLIAAAARGDLALTKLLLARGADVNAAISNGGKVRHGDIALRQLTPLMLACSYGTPAMVRTLLAAGAHVNDRDIRGMTPLMFAASSEAQRPQVVALLLEAGADPALKDGTGDTALAWARKFGRTAVVQTLEAGSVSPTALPVPTRASAPQTPGAALGQALALLGKSSQEFFASSGCVACHHQIAATRAWGAAHRAGVISDESPARIYAAGLTAARPIFEPGAMQMIGPPGDLDTIAYTLFAAVDANAPASPLTDAAANFIANRQWPDGHWETSLGGISRAPLEESDITRTMMSIRILKNYSWPARKVEFDERIARGRRWLEAAQPQTRYEMAELLLGLYWAGAPAAVLRPLGRELLTVQREDGGWAQNANLPSDAYITGLVLFALHETAQADSSAPAYKKGVDYLLRTQLDDGSWYVPSRAPKFQPYFQSGFPHNHDQWISAAATSMAVMGLSPAAR